MEKAASRDLVVHPENAEYFITQNLGDASDLTLRLAVSAHATREGTAGNVWLCAFGEWRRLLPERKLNGNPSWLVLWGEVGRVMTEVTPTPPLNETRLNWGLWGLKQSIDMLKENPTLRTIED